MVERRERATKRPARPQKVGISTGLREILLVNLFGRRSQQNGTAAVHCNRVKVVTRQKNRRLPLDEASVCGHYGRIDRLWVLTTRDASTHQRYFPCFALSNPKG